MIFLIYVLSLIGVNKVNDSFNCKIGESTPTLNYDFYIVTLLNRKSCTLIIIYNF